MASPTSSPERASCLTRPRGWRLGGAFALALAACEKEAPPAPAQTAPSVSEPAPANAADRPKTTDAPPAAEVRAAVAKAGPDCRATSVAGRAQFGSGETLERGEKLLGKGWLELDADARVVVKHTQTAREWVLEGPASAAFCPEGREEILLGSGKLQTEMGAGARPGGEVTVGTPFGAVSYGDARLKLQVSEKSLALVSEAGDAWLTPTGPKVAGDVHVSAGAKERRTRRLRAAEALALCADAAKRTEELARALPTPSSGGAGLGQRAAEHMRARKSARSTCASAAAAVIAELRGREREDRLRELVGHERAWQRVASAVDDPK